MQDRCKPSEPRWPFKVLKKLCKSHYLEEIEGDLHEAYEARIRRHKPIIAKALYLVDVLSFLRLSLIRKPLYSKTNSSDMFRNHFKIATRVLSKSKLFSLINMAGLAIGISAYLLITQYVRFESSYDTQHSHIEDLYRVTLSNARDNGKEGVFGTAVASNHPAVGSAMKRDFPEVDSYVRLVDKTVMWGSFVLSYTGEDGKRIKVNANDSKIFVSDASVLDVFHIPLISGNPETALKEPMSIIISADEARRFFGTEDPLNKVLKVNGEHPLKVTGVFETLSQNTHLQFDMLASFSTLGDWVDTNWIWPEFYNYVRLRPGTDPKQVEEKFPAFVDKYMSEIMAEHGFKTKFGLQPVRDIHLKSKLGKEMSVNSSEQTLYFLMIIAGFVIGIALINFVNLSTAKSIERAKEVGLKKVVGASRRALIGQFLFESFIINCIGLVIAIALVSILMTPFNQLVGLEVLSLSMWRTAEVWMTLLILLISGGLLAGIYPAFVLSSFKPVQVLKGKFAQSGKGAFLRKMLVIVQFSVSLALIAGTTIVYNQFYYMQNQELGYDAAHSLVINAPMVVEDSLVQQKMEIFKNEIQRNPNVNAVTLTNDIPGKRITWLNGTRRIGVAKEDGAGTYLMTVDHDFLPVYKIKLLAGRNFTAQDQSSFDDRKSNPIHAVIINKTLANTLGFEQAEQAIDERIIFVLGTADRQCRVIGVVDDYHQQSLQNEFEPTLFFYPDFYSALYITVNINTSQARETIDAITTQYGNFFPHDPFNYFFLDDYFNQQYQADLKFGKICFLFSGLAIFIAALGLFGLGSYMALQKMKEICVRKVLGASLIQVLILIPRSMLSLILISGLIALPIVYFLTEDWLSGYAFRVSMNVWMFLFPLVIVLLVAVLSVLLQSIKVASVNPADSLRNE